MEQFLSLTGDGKHANFYKLEGNSTVYDGITNEALTLDKYLQRSVKGDFSDVTERKPELIQFVIGQANPASSAASQRVRKVIDDVFGNGRNGFDLQCTDYATYKVKTVLGVTIHWPVTTGRHGGKWDDIFEKHTLYTVLKKPEKHATFHMPETPQVPTGHVGFVEDILPDGSIKVSECNWPGQGKYNERIVTPAKFANWRFVRYL
jgi:surface antigen